MADAVRQSADRATAYHRALPARGFGPLGSGTDHRRSRRLQASVEAEAGQLACAQQRGNIRIRRRRKQSRSAAHGRQVKEAELPATTVVWPKKTRELQNTLFDSTRWNDFKFRDGHIIVATWGKSGTTWTQPPHWPKCCARDSQQTELEIW